MKTYKERLDARRDRLDIHIRRYVALNVDLHDRGGMCRTSEIMYEWYLSSGAAARDLRLLDQGRWNYDRYAAELHRRERDHK